MKREARRRLRLLIFSVSAPCCDALFVAAAFDLDLDLFVLMVLRFETAFGVEDDAEGASVAFESIAVASEAMTD